MANSPHTETRLGSSNFAIGRIHDAQQTGIVAFVWSSSQSIPCSVFRQIVLVLAIQPWDSPSPKAHPDS